MMRLKGFALLLVCWPIFALATGTADSHVKAQIDALLLRARKALAQDRLTLPSDDNAVGYVQKVLTLSPAHPEAQRILKEIVDRYALIADAAMHRAEALRSRELEKARTYRSRGERVANRYGLADEKLRGISKRIAGLEKKELRASSKGATFKNQSQRRDLLKRVVARYLDKSGNALDLGGMKKARFYHDIARELVQSYRLPEAGLEQLGRRIAEAERDATDPAKVQSVFLPPAF